MAVSKISVKVRPMLYQEIDNIPANGEWWKQSTRVAYQKAGLKMLEAGLSLEKTLEILGDLFGATAEEFGY